MKGEQLEFDFDYKDQIIDKIAERLYFWSDWGMEMGRDIYLALFKKWQQKEKPYHELPEDVKENYRREAEALVRLVQQISRNKEVQP